MVDGDFVNQSSFFRTMLALAALDIVMLFFILNPLSKPSNSLPSWHAQQPRAAHAVAKPSPLGHMVAVTYRH